MQNIEFIEHSLDIKENNSTDVCSRSCYIENWKKIKENWKKLNKFTQNQRKLTKIKENWTKLKNFNFSEKFSDENIFLQFSSIFVNFKEISITRNMKFNRFLQFLSIFVNFKEISFPWILSKSTKIKET